MRYHFTLVRMAIIKKSTNKGFPGGSVVKKKRKNLPSNARNVGLIPGLEKSHMPQSN